VDPGKKKFDFSREISEKFRFFQRKIWTFASKLTKNFYFSMEIGEKFRFFQAN